MRRGEKHGAKSRRGWCKLHLALDASSGEIIAHTMTDQDTGDTSQVAPLLDQIGGPVGRFTADGAYDGKPTYDAIIGHSADAAIVIPPRVNAIEPTGDQPPGQRDTLIAAIIRDGRMKWQASTGYGRRALVETAIGRYKSTIGGVFRLGRFTPSRRKLPSAAPSSTACLPAHARNPPAAIERTHGQPHQRPASVQACIHAPKRNWHRLLRLAMLWSSITSTGTVNLSNRTVASSCGPIKPHGA